MNKLLKFLIATFLWTIILAPVVGIFGFLFTWALDYFAGLYFPDGVAFTALVLAIVGLIGARSTRDEVEGGKSRKWVSSMFAIIGNGLNTFRSRYKPSISKDKIIFKSSNSRNSTRNKHERTWIRGISPDSELEALSKVHSIVSGDIFRHRSFDGQTEKETDTIYAHQD